MEVRRGRPNSINKTELRLLACEWPLSERGSEGLRLRWPCGELESSAWSLRRPQIFATTHQISFLFWAKN